MSPKDNKEELEDNQEDTSDIVETNDNIFGMISPQASGELLTVALSNMGTIEHVEMHHDMNEAWAGQVFFLNNLVGVGLELSVYESQSWHAFTVVADFVHKRMEKAQAIFEMSYDHPLIDKTVGNA